MKKILPIHKPSICSYTHQCVVHAILMAHDECQDWIYSNYIQIYCLKDLFHTHREGTLDFYYHFYGDFNFYEQYSNPWLHMNRLSRQNVRNKWHSEINYIEENIMDDRYIFAVIDKKFAYNSNKSFYHPVLVYGYDNEKSILYCADNNIYGKYDLMEIPYNNYLEGCNIPEIEDYYGKRPEGICTFKIRKKKDDIDSYKFYVEKVIQDFKSYINPISGNDIAHVYGVNCYDELCKYYTLVKSNTENCDLRAISSLLDHKTLMVERFNYMKAHKHILANHDQLIPGAERIRDLINKYQKLLIKYNVTRNGEIINKVIDGLKVTRKEEVNMLRKSL